MYGVTGEYRIGLQIHFLLFGSMDGFQLWLLSFGFENEYKDDDLIDWIGM